MTIPEIKARLPMAEVLAHYGLKPDGRGRLRCPFHEDRNPSMQVYVETGTVYCFSGNCRVHGRSLDVIDFVLEREGLTKAEAITRCKGMVGGAAPSASKPKAKAASAPSDLARAAVLQRAFAYMRGAVKNAPAARAYLNGRGLGPEALAGRGLEVGYVTGQMHHGKRASRELIASLVGVGLLTPTGQVSGRSGREGYRTFAKGSVCFPLRGMDGKVSGLYFRSVDDGGGKGERHRFLRDRRGLYPGYPAPTTKRLLVCESVIDAASAVAAGVGDAGWAVLALYGTSGWTGEHAAAVAGLTALEEACVLLDGDEAGRRATAQVAAKLAEARPGVRVSTVELPEGADCNGLLVAHGPEAIAHVIEERVGVEEPTDEVPSSPEPAAGDVKPTEPPTPAAPVKPGRLDESRPHDLAYWGRAGEYRVKGFRVGQLDSLKATVQIGNLSTAGGEEARTVTLKVDLYEWREVERACRLAADELGLNAKVVRADLERLARELEGYAHRRREGGATTERRAVAIPAAERAACLAFWRAPDLMTRLSERIGRAGLVGEEANRLLLFVVASTYRMPHTLHAIIQGSSGSGKTRLLDVIARCMPAEDVRRYTRVTDNAFYNQAEDHFRQRLLCLEDLDGLREEAQLAVRELMSNEVLRSAVSVKDDRTGAISGGERVVRGPVATLACTTRGEVYEDNVSRSLVVAVDESAAQTARVIAYQDARAAGRSSRAEQEREQRFLANCVRLLEPVAVVNPYAGRVSLPEGAHKLRRLHELYLSFVRQVCLLHQYQRRRDASGRLVAEVADLRCAADVLFEAIVLKVDELEGSTRQFYERLKSWVASRGPGADASMGASDDFTQREVREALHVSRAQCSRLFGRLRAAEYLTARYAGNARKVCYRLDEPDDYARLRGEVKAALTRQIDAIEGDEAAGEGANEQVR